MLMNLIESDGIQVRKQAGTNGGEYAGPCPFCGGEDRFRVWPEQGRYWCRVCGAKGDAIQYLRDKHGKGYLEACQGLGIEPKKYQNTKHNHSVVRPKEVRETKHGKSQEWQKQAMSFLKWSQEQLQGNQKAREYLASRGIKDTSFFGWNPKDIWQDRSKWGLPPETNQKTGKPKKVWLPSGIVIPSFAGEQLERIRIRRSDTDQNKYIWVSGSIGKPLILGQNRQAWVIVESELDGYLIHQHAGDIVSVMALGSAQQKPDQISFAMLIKADMVLIALDTDEAGAKGSRNFWENMPNGKRWPVPVGKDPGEMYQAGIPVRKWIEAGLNKPQPKEAGQPGQHVISVITDNYPAFQGWTAKELRAWKRCLECDWCWKENGVHICLKQKEARIDVAFKTCSFQRP
ncbi:zinc-binding protein [Desulfonema ishimotonii]|uniref:Zinc-binding protein n=1 Tax=Desulfonema ishimotonii TaxID=45657 RepID=A0A401G158_9BACT|nr:primase-helicase zinc-binding domain-containing protein [Desulfonema ishimotonii]GBC62959.1 zinc-binding protein [Desulfonema ishimotonii]